MAESIMITIPVKFEKNYAVRNPVTVCPLELFRTDLADSIDKYVASKLLRLYDAKDRIVDINEEEGIITYADKLGRLFTYDASLQNDAETVCKILKSTYDKINVDLFTHSQIDLMLRAAVFNAVPSTGLKRCMSGSDAVFAFADVINYLIDCK